MEFIPHMALGHWAHAQMYGLHNLRPHRLATLAIAKPKTILTKTHVTHAIEANHRNEH